MAVNICLHLNSQGQFHPTQSVNLHLHSEQLHRKQVLGESALGLIILATKLIIPCLLLMGSVYWMGQSCPDPVKEV